MGPYRDQERQQRQERHGHPRTAHREHHPSNGTHPDKKPEPGQAIHKAQRRNLEAEKSQQEHREAGSASCSRSLARWMRPHDPGVADGKKEQGEATHRETKPGVWFAYQRSKGKEQTYEPEVLVEPPEL